jgi:carboxymethylenebutenolidase
MSGMQTGDTGIPTSDGAIPGYRAMPDAGEPIPVVLVVQEIFGVNEHMRDVCPHFAKLGYMAIAPELYFRQGDVSKMQDHQEIISKVVSKVPDQQLMSDLDAAVALAAGTGFANTSRLGIVGFCWGGRQDKGTPIEQVHQMQQALLQSGKDSTNIVYPDAGHGFFGDYRASYREPDAENAWGHLLEWFRAHGVA